MKQLPNLKFKERESTKGIVLYYTEDDMPMKEYARYVMRKGWFSIGYNYLLHADGTLEEGMPQNQVCDPSLYGWDDHICLLVMGHRKDTVNHVQDEVLFNLSKDLNLPLVHRG